jgi:bud site selection protein 31
MSQWGRKLKPAPEDYEVVRSTLVALENELRDKVNESHEGKRKMESQWPVHQLNWQRTRYIFDLHYKYNRISKALVDYLVESKAIDGALLAFWQKPGYERLCSTFSVNTKNAKFGTTSICRVPAKMIDEGTIVENSMTGCRGCSSDTKSKNIFGNKYGEYLADIHMAREMRAAKQGAVKGSDDDSDDGDDDNEDEDDDEKEDDNAPVGAADGSAGNRRDDLWQKRSDKIDEGALEKVAAAAKDKRALSDQADPAAATGGGGAMKKPRFEPPGKRRR